jgi:dinuclear metal center YbgI/SA1388 family protein
MTTVDDIRRHLDAVFLPRLAEEWDNTGLLVGRKSAPVQRVMTCLTITPSTAAEAITRQTDLVVAHHPLPFRPLQKITEDTTPARLLLDLIENRIAVYSPHTSFDSAATGINQQLAVGIGLTGISPLIPDDDDPDVGAARHGEFAEPLTLSELADRVTAFLGVSGIKTAGPALDRITRVAVACGSGGEFLGCARRSGCQALVTGETNFHTCLEAESVEMALLLPGHYASERFAIEKLAERLGETFSNVEIWASADESDPIRWNSNHAP